MLEVIVGDPKASWLGRKAAVESLAGLGAPKATLERLRKKLEAAKDYGDKAVLEALEKAVAAAK